jgi:hypothetical protein
MFRTNIFKNYYRVFLLVLLAAALALPSCQDDPVLEPTDNGNPVITPKTKASITLIQLNSYPPVDPAGDLWDPIDSANFDYQGSPDIFFNITEPSPQPPVLWSQNSHFSNVTATDTVPFTLISPYQVIPFGSSIDVNVYDYELPDSTLMGTVNFLIGPYPDPLNPYPSYVTSTQNGYSVTIGIKWKE